MKAVKYTYKRRTLKMSEDTAEEIIEMTPTDIDGVKIKGVSMKRSNLFSKFSDVAMRDMEDGGCVCFNCKLAEGMDMRLHPTDNEIDVVEDKIEHINAHKAAGHTVSNYTLGRLTQRKEILERSVKVVTVHYAIGNGGDGSAYPLFFETAENATAYDEQIGEEGEGWGEDCSGTAELHFDAQGVLINSREFDQKHGMY